MDYIAGDREIELVAALPRRHGNIDTNFVLHYIRVMKTRLRNITVTLQEDVARWARVAAAHRETSVSRFLGELLKEKMLEEEAYEGAMRRTLSRKPFLKTDGRYLSRSDAHDRRA